MNYQNWIKKDIISKITSKWVNIFCETWDDGDKEIEYWRIEKDSSIVIITETDDYLVLPKMQFRPGVGSHTMDFPGGRFNSEEEESDTAKKIITRELSIEQNKIISLDKIAHKDYIINSSFNNQKLVVYSSKVDMSPNEKGIIAYKKSDYHALLNDLDCLQCNFALRLWVEYYS